MKRSSLAHPAVLSLALSVAGCNCGSHHGKPDTESRADGGVDPHAGTGGRDAQDAGSAGRGGASGDRSDAEVLEDAAVDSGVEAPELVPTSGSHAVLLLGLPEDGALRQVIALDLGSGDTHLLGEGDTLSFAFASPDGTAILFGGDLTANQDNFFLARVRDDGVVPAARVRGFEGDYGHRELLGWTEDSRFALLTRHSNFNAHAIDLVDTRQERRHWSIEGDITSFKAGAVAPRGPWFHYTITGNGASSGIGRIDTDGVALFEIPDMTASAFNPNGTRVMYATGGIYGEYRDLSAPDTTKPIVALDPAVSGLFPVAFSGDDHIVAMVLTPASPRTLGRVDLRTSEMTEITLPAMGFPLLSSADGSTLLGIEGDSALPQDVLWLIDTLNQHEPAQVGTLIHEPSEGVLLDTRIGTAGPRHFFYALSERDLTFVARASDGAVASIEVSDPEDTAFSCLPEATDTREDAERFAFLANDGATLIVLDLSQPLAERVARIEAADSGTFACPIWNADRSALALVEQAGSRSSLYTIAWPQGGVPAEPVIAYESDAPLSLIAYRP